MGSNAFVVAACPNAPDHSVDAYEHVFCPCGYAAYLQNRSLGGEALYQCRRCGKQYKETEVEANPHKKEDCPYCEAKAAERGNSK